MNARFNQVINCKFIKNIKLNKMEEQVNKLIEKIENENIQHYDFNEVLHMLKDLLVKNAEKIKTSYCWEEDICGSYKRCKYQCEDCKVY
jgi:hypothetical protein